MATVLAPYVPCADESDVLALRASVWGVDHPHTSEAFFRWLFRQGGAGEDCGVVLRRDGAAVGFGGLVGRSLSARRREVRVAHGLDFMVDPAVRGTLSGLFATRMCVGWADMARSQHYALGVCFPNTNSIRLLTSERLGWVPVLSPRLLLRPLRGLRFRTPPSPFAGLPAWSVTAAGRAAALASSAVAAVAAGTQGDRRIIEICDFDARFDDLWRRASGSIIAFRRDRETLAWRYRAHPLYDYRVMATVCGDALDGFVVSVRRELMGLRSDLLVDALWDPESPATIAPLIQASVARSHADGADIVGALAPEGSPLGRALLRTGFMPVPRRFDPKPFWLTAKIIDQSAGELLTPVGWHLTWGDMDVV
jgi:hypothetical protein